MFLTVPIYAWEDTISAENAHELEMLHTLEFENPITSIRFYNETKMVISSGLSLFIYDLETLDESPYKIDLENAEAVITALAIHPDGKILAASDAAGKIFLWDLEHNEWLETLSVLTHLISDLDFSPDGKSLAAVDETGVYFWDVQTLELTNTYQQFAYVFRMAFSPDSSLFGVSGTELTIIEITSGEIIVSNSELYPNDVVFGLDGNNLLFTTTLHGVGMLELDDNADAHYLSKEKLYRPFTAISLNPEGSLVISGDYDGAIHMWHISSSTEFSVSPQRGSSVNDIQFNLDGTLFAVAFDDYVVEVWGIPASD